jgi:hypothetical protein
MMAAGGLSLQDILDLPEQPQAPRKPLVKRLRDSHHAVARFVAEGRDNQEISALTGYDPARISLFKKDPAFAELVSFYKARVEEQFLDVHARMAVLSGDAVAELQNRLDENPDGFTNGQVMELVKLTADRTGLGPTKKHEVLGMMLDASAIASIREQVKNNGKVQKIQTADQGTELGSTLLPAIEHSPVPAEGVEAAGAAVRTEGSEATGEGLRG